jgi:multidrug resistance efflux pump
VAAIDPAPVRAPFEGVVESILVAPNATVAKGEPLVALDRTQSQARADVAQKALEMAQAEHAVASQQALNDADAKARLAILSGKIEQAAAERDYAKGLLDRAVVPAPADGVAVFDGAADWRGKPVQLGERIMLIASPERTELEMLVPAADAVTFEPGAEVLFFGNLAPDRPVRAVVSFASYAAGTVAYVFRARFQDAPPQRLGMKGTAKIYGERVPLALWLLRRPVAAVRQWLAL